MSNETEGRDDVEQTIVFPMRPAQAHGGRAVQMRHQTCKELLPRPTDVPPGTIIRCPVCSAIYIKLAPYWSWRAEWMLWLTHPVYLRHFRALERLEKERPRGRHADER